MDEQRKYAILFGATILAARRLQEIGDKPCPARECAIAGAVENANRVLEKLMNGGRQDDAGIPIISLQPGLGQRTLSSPDRREHDASLAGHLRPSHSQR